MGKKPVWQAYNTLITLRTTRYIWHISYICCDLFLHYVNNSFKGVLRACLMFIPKLIKRDLVRIQGCFFTPQEKTSLLKLTLQWLKNPFLWVQNKLSLNKMQLSFKQNLVGLSQCSFFPFAMSYSFQNISNFAQNRSAPSWKLHSLILLHLHSNCWCRHVSVNF